MTVRRQYRCNLCHSEIHDTTVGGIGIRWGSKDIKSTLMVDSEHHICQPCLTALEEMLTDMRQHAAIRANVSADTSGQT